MRMRTNAIRLGTTTAAPKAIARTETKSVGVSTFNIMTAT